MPLHRRHRLSPPGLAPFALIIHLLLVSLVSRSAHLLSSDTSLSPLPSTTPQPSTASSSSSFSIFASATKITWTPAESTSNTKKNNNQNNQKPNAATAPRSQRYWDEHNIDRPDYAKTDAEIAAERSAKFADASNTTGGRVVWMVVLMAVGYGYAVYSGRVVPFWEGGSHRLGGAGSGGIAGIGGLTGSSKSREEESRAARLARFDRKEVDKEE